MIRLTIYYYLGNRDRVLEILKKNKIKVSGINLTQDDMMRNMIIAYGDMSQVELLNSFPEIQTVAWRNEEDNKSK